MMAGASRLLAAYLVHASRHQPFAALFGVKSDVQVEAPG